MNDEIYDELDKNDAVLVGILSELTQIRVSLQTMANQTDQQTKKPRFECISCGEKHYERDELLKHIVRKHSAPDEEAAKRLVEVL